MPCVSWKPSLARAFIRGARNAHLVVDRVEIDKAGKIIIVAGKADKRRLSGVLHLLSPTGMVRDGRRLLPHEYSHAAGLAACIALKESGT
jgi:hypothetical protein